MSKKDGILDQDYKVSLFKAFIKSELFRKTIFTTAKFREFLFEFDSARFDFRSRKEFTSALSSARKPLQNRCNDARDHIRQLAKDESFVKTLGIKVFRLDIIGAGRRYGKTEYRIVFGDSLSDVLHSEAQDEEGGLFSLYPELLESFELLQDYTPKEIEDARDYYYKDRPVEVSKIPGYCEKLAKLIDVSRDVDA